jgi:hypothetical protein
MLVDRAAIKKHRNEILMHIAPYLAEISLLRAHFLNSYFKSPKINLSFGGSP